MHFMALVCVSFRLDNIFPSHNNSYIILSVPKNILMSETNFLHVLNMSRFSLTDSPFVILPLFVDEDMIDIGVYAPKAKKAKTSELRGEEAKSKLRQQVIDELQAAKRFEEALAVVNNRTSTINISPCTHSDTNTGRHLGRGAIVRKKR
jgi:hypothetical protein